MASPGTIRFVEINATPSAPPVGSAIIYVKTDNVVYLQDSSGVEVALGTASGITALTGEATAVGPGSSIVTLNNSAVIGKVLTGFVAGPNSLVLATDTLIAAIQKLQSQITSSSGSAITSLTGDVTGTGPGSAVTTVASVGGKSASSVALAVTDVQAATSLNTASTIVKRNASGNFIANVITASLIGNATTATTSSNFSGSLVGDVTGTQGATVVSAVSGKSAANVATSVDDTQAATSINTASTIVKRDASGNFSAASVTANLVGNVTGSASGNVLKTGDTMTGPLLNTNTTQSTTKDTGSVILEGGLGVEKNINAGGTILASNFSGTASGTNSGDVTVTDTNTIDITLTGQNVQADVRISDATLASDVNGLKVGTISFTQVSGFNEAAQDAVGTILLDTPTIDLTYDDATPFISAAVRLSDSTIISDANGIKVGVLPAGNISTAAPVTQTPSQPNTEGVSTSLARADHIHNIPVAVPVQIGTANSVGTAASFALSDHVHSHGNQTVGTLHAIVTNVTNGFMSTTDKVKLDAATALNTPSSVVMRDASGNFAAGVITANLTGAASANLLKAGDSMSGYFRSAIVALTDGATIATDVTLGNIFTVTLAGNRTLSNPTGMVSSRQKVTWAITQDGTGNRLLSFGSSFNFGVDLTGLALSTTAGATDYIGAMYNPLTSRWDVIAIVRGY